MNPESGLSEDLERIYSRRFDSNESYRNLVWKTLIEGWFQKYVPSGAAVLDLGCGYGQFINNIQCAQKYAMDLNPAAMGRLNPDVMVRRQDCTSKWDFGDDSLDVIFTSNFFEHLSSKEALTKTIAEARRCLRSGGKLIAMGPNVKFVGGAYWDYFDHHIALTDRSLVEALETAGFQDRRCAGPVSALHDGRFATLSNVNCAVISALADPLENLWEAVSGDRRQAGLMRRSLVNARGRR